MAAFHLFFVATLFKGPFPIKVARSLLAHLMRRWQLSLSCSYNVIALSSGRALRATFDGVSFLPSRFWDAEDRIVLSYISKPFGLSLHVLDNTSPRRGPWALIESEPGSQILWAHNSNIALSKTFITSFIIIKLKFFLLSFGAIIDITFELITTTFHLNGCKCFS